eukprot:4761476-Pleurochrysis_carterae.AAC.4
MIVLLPESVPRLVLELAFIYGRAVAWALRLSVSFYVVNIVGAVTCWAATGRFPVAVEGCGFMLSSQGSASCCGRQGSIECVVWQRGAEK